MNTSTSPIQHYLKTNRTTEKVIKMKTSTPRCKKYDWKHTKIELFINNTLH